MRTIKEAMAWIMETDPNTSITPHALRRLIVSGEIPRVVVSNKYLVNLDDLDSYLRNKNGNITPPERSCRRSGEYAHILQLIARHEEKLTETLTEAQKETFKKFKDATSELSGMSEVTAFTIGFKLGAATHRRSACRQRLRGGGITHTIDLATGKTCWRGRIFQVPCLPSGRSTISSGSSALTYISSHSCCA